MIDVYIAGNSPYYQALTKMAQQRGWTVKSSFNCEYEKNLPRAENSLLLIETQNDVPVMPLATLEEYYPGASWGIRDRDGTIMIGQTTIVFVDFARPLAHLHR